MWFYKEMYRTQKERHYISLSSVWHSDIHVIYSTNGNELIRNCETEF